MNELADKLEALQATKNDGRGVSCVRDIILYLRRNDIEGAKAVYDCDGDKICGSYPDIDKMICMGLKIEPRYGYDYSGWETKNG